MKTTKKIIAGAVAVLTLAAASVASATPIKWTFDKATFTDGGTISGWLSVDSTGGGMFDWDFTTSAGTELNGFHYTVDDSRGSKISSTGYMFYSTDPSSRLYFLLGVSAALTAPGTVDLVSNSTWECNNCSPYRYASGQLTTASAADVPEPGTLALVGVALAGLARSRKRRAV